MDLTPLFDRLDRALDHLEALKREEAQFLNTEPYAVTLDGNADTGTYVWRVNVRSEPPRLMSLLVGDCVHNIRAPLDNLIWSLSAGAPSEVRRNAAFVVTLSSEEFANNLQRRKLKGLPERARRIVEAVQPFQPSQLPGVGRYVATFSGERVAVPPQVAEDPHARRDARGRAENHPLWVLDRLWNDDKHRAPPLCGALVAGSEIDVEGIAPDSVNSMEIVSELGMIHDGQEIFELRVPPRSFVGEAQPKFKPVFQVSLNYKGWAFRGPVVPLLLDLHDCIRYRLLPHFADM